MLIGPGVVEAGEGDALGELAEGPGSEPPTGTEAVPPTLGVVPGAVTGEGPAADPSRPKASVRQAMAPTETSTNAISSHQKCWRGGRRGGGGRRRGGD